jgi:alkanesulfonate monooxygenase SsuD/methylene tetrahydromethanopterin reductase-like flavin-dependent oxidoreductase (luciferase family)
MSRPLKVGFILPQIEGRGSGHTPRWSEIAEMARIGEDMGFDSLWVVDHLLYGFGTQDPPRGVWEGWTLLSALAAITTRAELGTLVVCTGFRNPALLAKMADTVEEISDGRLILGLGAGYFELEYRAFGFPYDHRFSRFAEALEIIATLLKEGRVDYEGRFYSARDCELRPRGPRSSGPPIMIGTRGEKMLRLTATHADSWNGWLTREGNALSAIPPLREAVDAACHNVGRDPATLERTATVMVDPFSTEASRRPNGPISGTPEQIAEQLAAFAGEGITHLQIASRVTRPRELEAFAPILAALDTP